MKKNYAITLMIIVGYACSTNQSQVNQSQMNQKRTGLGEFNLNGKVKSFSETTYDACEEFGNLKRGIKRKYISYLFDNNGRQLEQIREVDESPAYGDRGRIKYTWAYDNIGNKTELSFYKLGREKQSSSTSLLSDTTYINETDSVEVNTGVYDGKDSSIAITNSYRYDDKGNLVEENEYGYDGTSHTRKCINTYDVNGYKTVSVEYNGFGGLDNKIIFKYDESCKLIEADYRWQDSWLSSKIFYKYDDKGNVTEQTTTEYDQNNVETGNRFITYKYEYDIQGNWIRRIYDGNGIKITERKIIYF